MTGTTSNILETPADHQPKPTVPKKPNKRRALVQVDHRNQIGRRVKELTEVLRARIPDADDPVTATAIRRCAETTALSEHLRGRALRGEIVSADDVLRATRTADLLTRRLHLDRNRKPTAPSLSSYIAARGDQP